MKDYTTKYQRLNRPSPYEYIEAARVVLAGAFLVGVIFLGLYLIG